MFNLHIETRGLEARTSHEDEEHPLGHEITVIFLLPDSRKVGKKFRIGQTVDFLKLCLEEDFGYKFHQQDFELQGLDEKEENEMPDPFSLNDFPSVREKNKAVIKVLVDENREDSELEEEIRQYKEERGIVESDSSGTSKSATSRVVPTNQLREGVGGDRQSTSQPKARLEHTRSASKALDDLADEELFEEDDI